MNLPGSKVPGPPRKIFAYCGFGLAGFTDATSKVGFDGASCAKQPVHANKALMAERAQTLSGRLRQP